MSQFTHLTPLLRLCLFIILVPISFSCSGDNDLPPPVSDPLLMDKETKLLELATSYSTAGSSAKNICIITEDAANRTVTEWFSLSDKNFRRHHYDNDGNLVKIVISFSDGTSRSLDSVIIKRPAAGQFEIWKNDKILLQKANRSVSPDGGEKILVESTDNSAVFLTLTFNRDALLVSQREQLMSLGLDGHNIAYTYDASHKLTGMSDTVHSLVAGNRLVHHYNVSTDNASNSYLIYVLEKLVGRDMRWRLYYADQSPGYFTPSVLSIPERFEQTLMLAKGSVTKLKLQHFTAQPDGSFVESPVNGENALLYNWQYDDRGRAINCKTANTNSADYRGELQIKYFD
ncbi:hypothetical protein LZZ85_16000 [Terrimonas sp. NA20]|uniref:DUF4595 domain-containing protein n=1 Tax=Terrimonas ginsenosidimutans TaxID=2908004 RepID=A0ABS9KU54_9BACT|nr:hypothetical protein [Terrimonas ginsenosidimutans]MCG2615804.1 hypothetical protein [Terrimonas ginsenosidimutans]